MRIYRGSDADIVLRPFMIKLSEIVSFDLQLWTTGTYVIKRSTTESGMTIDKINNIVNVHLTDKETSYLDAGVLNAKLMYRITDSEYPDGTYDGIITIPQEYYMMTPPEYSGGTVGDIYESGYTEGYNTAIQNSVLSINGEKGDLNLKTINGNGLLGEGDIKIEGGGSSTGSDNVIVLDGLTQEERKAIHDKLDLTKPLVKSFMYEGKISVCAWDSGGGNVKFLTFGDNYDGIQVKRYNFSPDGWLGEDNRGHTYTNSVVFSLGTHVEESGYFECMYIGNFFEYILRPYTRPNACFINLEKGIGDSTRPIYTPVSTLVEKYEERTNVRMQFIANEKLYTFLLDPNQENKWLFESAKPITGGGTSGDIPTKVSQLENDNKYINQSSQSSTYNIEHIWTGNQSQYDALETKDARTLFIII